VEKMIESRPIILLVDDMKINLVFLSEILQDTYTIKIAKNGQKAIEMVQNGRVDLILLDIVMPEMDGYEVCSSLKQDEKTKDIPIIFVTGNTAAEDEEKGFKLGAVDYITKPYQPTIVRSRVKTHIDLHLRQIELERITQTMQEQNTKLKRYTRLIDQHIITSSTDLYGVITEVSTAFCQISGYAKEELVGQKQSIVRHPDFPDSFYKDLWGTIVQDKTWSGEIKNLKKDGNFYWVKAFISPIFEKGVKVGYTAIRQDITDKKRIEEISITDGLTNIYNRRHFNDIFPSILLSAQRKDEIVCFLILDIDHFKQYNDNYGHQMGDEVLIKFSASLKESLQRADDIPFRLGGEEFGIIYKADNEAHALEFAEAIRQNIYDLKIPHEYSSVSPYITASMGLICGHASVLGDVDTLFKQADDLLYKAKENGRNQVRSKIIQ
jgi:diguanylate cyclase (GGDEF)-like protein/PAS domain S-box-containing protein